MSVFAKLYERDGRQVLVTKDENDDGEPCLSFRFQTNVAEHSVTTKIEFKKDAKLDKWEVMDRAFDNVTEQAAFDIRDGSPGVGM